MSKLRVMILIQRFYPIVGGMERQCQAILSRLVAYGWDVTVLTHRPAPGVPSETRVAGVPVRRLGRGTWSPSDVYTGWWGILSTLYRERCTYDLIHVYGAGHLASIALLIGGLAGKPIVVRPATQGDVSRYLHGERRPEPTWLGRLVDVDPLTLKGRLFKQATAWIALTAEIQDELQTLGVPVQRIHLIPNGVDETYYRPADATTKQRLRETLDLPASAVVFLFVGRFVRRKGLLDLLNAWQLVVGTEDDIYLVLAGAGQDQPDSVESDVLAKVDQFPAVRHMGLVDDPIDLYRVADVFVLPSYREGLPNALLEGMACGLAPVATDIGGIADIIEPGRNGLTVPPGRVSDLASAMKTLVQHPELREALATAARETVIEGYSLSQTVAAYARLYQMCTGMQP
jgi:glycosyltransferase involved in cell wall biosynthesis